MPSKTAYPPVISVAATNEAHLVLVKWSFTRFSIRHYFSMHVLTLGELERPIKDHEFRIAVSTSKGGKGPRFIETTHKINEVEYRDMIESVVQLVRKHDLIRDAQTAPKGTASTRDPAFIYPTWRDTQTGYDPRVLRNAVTANRVKSRLDRSANIVKPNGQMDLNLQGTGNPAVDAIEIIEKHMPVEGDEFVEGVTAMQQQIEAMRKSIASQMDEFTKPPKNAAAIKVYSGYDVLLVRLLQHGDVLIAKRVRLPDTPGAADEVAAINRILEDAKKHIV